jgi:hypothetical protein
MYHQSVFLQVLLLSQVVFSITVHPTPTSTATRWYSNPNFNQKKKENGVREGTSINYRCQGEATTNNDGAITISYIINYTR